MYLNVSLDTTITLKMKTMLQLNFTPFPILTTQRLILRQLMADDEQNLFVLRSNEQVNRFLDRPIAQSSADALQFIEKINNAIGNNETIYWAIALKDDDKLIGTITLWNISVKNNMAELGFELLPQFQRKGIMHEAIAKVLAYGFDTMQLQTIEAYTHQDNEGSIKVLERNGFTKQSGPSGDGMILFTISRT
jgi:ribosomal-protein-alanine N-acetyltransferase